MAAGLKFSTGKCYLLAFLFGLIIAVIYGTLLNIEKEIKNNQPDNLYNSWENKLESALSKEDIDV
jgi:hypothetical protein